MDELTINGKVYQVKFDIRAFFIFGERRGIKGLQEVLQCIATELQQLENITQESFYFFGQIVYAGIHEADILMKRKTTISENEITDALFDDFRLLERVAEILSKSLMRFMGEPPKDSQTENP